MHVIYRECMCITSDLRCRRQTGSIFRGRGRRGSGTSDRPFGPDAVRGRDGSGRRGRSVMAGIFLFGLSFLLPGFSVCHPAEPRSIGRGIDTRWGAVPSTLPDGGWERQRAVETAAVRPARPVPLGRQGGRPQPTHGRTRRCACRGRDRHDDVLPASDERLDAEDRRHAYRVGPRRRALSGGRPWARRPRRPAGFPSAPAVRTPGSLPEGF